MLILLPPSEGKAAPARRGAAITLGDLSFPELTDVRVAVLDALIAVSGRPDGCEVLGVGTSLATAVQRNTKLLDLPTRQAIDTYTGVLYHALGHATLSTTARRRARQVVLIQSALWGPLRPSDRIPPYRLSMSTILPGVGTVARAWREVLDPVLTGLARAGGRTAPIVDCRSASYAAAWQPAADLAVNRVSIRVFTERAGRRSVVSHQAKKTRGLVARWLLEADRSCRTLADVVAVVREHRSCELTEASGVGFALDVIEEAGT